LCIPQDHLPFFKDFAHALYYLAAAPKHAAPMRKEIDSLINRESWSKDAINRMRKVDSFLKESMRMSGVSSRSSAHCRCYLITTKFLIACSLSKYL
jgi:hypothetical protein